MQPFLFRLEEKIRNGLYLCDTDYNTRVLIFFRALLTEPPSVIKNLKWSGPSEPSEPHTHPLPQWHHQVHGPGEARGSLCARSLGKTHVLQRGEDKLWRWGTCLFSKAFKKCSGQVRAEIPNSKPKAVITDPSLSSGSNPCHSLKCYSSPWIGWHAGCWLLHSIWNTKGLCRKCRSQDKAATMRREREGGKIRWEKPQNLILSYKISASPQELQNKEDLVEDFHEVQKWPGTDTCLVFLHWLGAA